ncbi:uncharacterized protein LOC131689517 [Topomyia yanbarensis]|uniref:uncharacterized protein LOC131689517 n=1 Tax=Topomyia yanbarensis TaxID=2498891 RepID=UPI00273A9F55|nr:uncharacterized protein LOC131689517 [Topomyia yanbarensis]
MEKSIGTEAAQQPPAENGNGTHKSAATVIQSPEQQQRPRKLSFDDTDVELSKLKLGAAVRRFPLPQILTATIAFALAGLLVRYLLPFNSGSLNAALDTLQQWRLQATERLTSSATIDYKRWYSVLQTRLSDARQQLEDPSLILLAALFGIGVMAFTYHVIYLDSNIPGVNPPTPFSASKKKRFSDKERRFHLGYVTALLSGLTVFLICMLVD